MNDQDYSELYDTLSNILRDKELVWVLDQVSEQIRLGKTESKEIFPEEEGRQQNPLPGVESRLQAPRGRRRKKEEFLVSTEYTPKEKLILLIDAIEQSVVNTNRMVYETLDFVQAKFGIRTIVFYSAENQREKEFTSHDFNESTQRITRLMGLLEELRRRINAD